MKHFFIGLLIVGSVSATEKLNTVDSLTESYIKKVQKVSDKSGNAYRSKISDALNNYRIYKEDNKADHDSFVKKIISFKKNVRDDKSLKSLIKLTRQTCRKNKGSKECRKNARTFKYQLNKHFEGKNLRIGFDENQRDWFILLSGRKMWGESRNQSDVIATRDGRFGFRAMIGLGLQISRSIVNFGVCSKVDPDQTGSFNIGVVASAVAGLGLTSGVYFGTNGVCFELGIMQGIGAYVAVSPYVFIPGGYNYETQGYDWGESSAFPAQIFK